MAVTAYWYAKAFISILNAEVDFQAGAAIAVLLTTSSYTPNQDTHDYGDDVTNEVAEANGYLQGLDGTGELLASPAVTTSANVATLDAVDSAWTATGAGITARRAVLVDVTTATGATDPLLLWIDFGQDETASGGGTFTIAYNASGIATITPADATGFP